MEVLIFLADFMFDGNINLKLDIMFTLLALSVIK